jgi:hypothetical protein
VQHCNHHKGNGVQNDKSYKEEASEKVVKTREILHIKRHLFPSTVDKLETFQQLDVKQPLKNSQYPFALWVCFGYFVLTVCINRHLQTAAQKLNGIINSFN